MTNEEFDKLVKEYKAQGLEDKDILNVLYKMYIDGKIEKEDLGKLAGALGYEFSEDFKDATEGSGEDGELTSEDVEDAQEVTPEEEEEEETEEEEESDDPESDLDDEDGEEEEESEDEDSEKDWKKNFYLD